MTNGEIIDAANTMLVEIPDEKKERLLQLKKAGYRLFLLSNTIDVHWDYCVEHAFSDPLVHDRVLPACRLSAASPCG